MNIKIKTSKRSFVARNVPTHPWKDLKPYWRPIAKAIIEVFLEGNFEPYAVRKNKKNGFYAAEYYWKKSLIDSGDYPLKEAKRFLNMLKENKDFIQAVKDFNNLKKSSWFFPSNKRQLRVFVHSVCYELESYIKQMVERFSNQQYL